MAAIGLGAASVPTLTVDTATPSSAICRTRVPNGASSTPPSLRMNTFFVRVWTFRRAKAASSTAG